MSFTVGLGYQVKGQGNRHGERQGRKEKVRVCNMHGMLFGQLGPGFEMK